MFTIVFFALVAIAAISAGFIFAQTYDTSKIKG